MENLTVNDSVIKEDGTIIPLGKLGGSGNYIKLYNTTDEQRTPASATANITFDAVLSNGIEGNTNGVVHLLAGVSYLIIAQTQVTENGGYISIQKGDSSFIDNGTNSTWTGIVVSEIVNFDEDTDISMAISNGRGGGGRYQARMTRLLIMEV